MGIIEDTKWEIEDTKFIYVSFCGTVEPCPTRSSDIRTSSMLRHYAASRRLILTCSWRLRREYAIKAQTRLYSLSRSYANWLISRRTSPTRNWRHESLRSTTGCSPVGSGSRMTAGRCSSRCFPASRPTGRPRNCWLPLIHVFRSCSTT